jgi:8-oxo-dGTP diphosphatase
MGQYQAKEILKNYLPYKVKEIYSSDAVRCLDTVNPLSVFLPLEIRVSRELSEYAFNKNSERPWKQIKKIRDKFFERNRNILICGHNPTLPELLKKLNRKSKAKVEKLDLAPGAGWVLHYNKKRIIQIDYMEAPSNNLFS